MANTVRVGAFLYRINPSNDKEMQRCPIGGNSWSRVMEQFRTLLFDITPPILPKIKENQKLAHKWCYFKKE